MNKNIPIIILLATSLFSLTGCASSVKYDNVKSYADNITTEVLTSMK